MPSAQQLAVYAALAGLARKGQLVFPVEVLKELERGANPTSSRPDVPLLWARGVAAHAVLNPSLDMLPEVLAKVPRVLDPDKAGGAEEADPYILACALELRLGGRDVAVITQEKNDYLESCRSPRRLGF